MRVQVRFVGHVQGVGFRATARSIARGFPITGWVRNEADRSVLLEAQGDAERVDAFLAELGRVMARNITGSDRMVIMDRAGEAGFEIKR